MSALGITTHAWVASLLLGIVLSLLEIAPLAFSPPVVPPERWLPMAAAGALALFEPLFVFGWLQLRLEKDFGVLPAIIIAALCFALYHVGYLPAAMGGQFTSAVVYAVLFRLTSNLLVTWPLLWAASTRGYVLARTSALRHGTWSAARAWRSSSRSCLSPGWD